MRVAVLAGVLFLAAPAVMRVITPGFDGEQLDNSRCALCRVRACGPQQDASRD